MKLKLEGVVAATSPKAFLFCCHHYLKRPAHRGFRGLVTAVAAGKKNTGWKSGK